MSKFCKNCGAEMSDEAVFCKVCGTSTQTNIATEDAQNNVQQESPVYSEASFEESNVEAPATETTKQPGFIVAINNYISKLKNKDQKTIFITSGIVLVLIALFVLAIVLPGGGPEDALDDYIEVYFKGDIDLVEDLAPEVYWEELSDKDNADLDVEDVQEYIEEVHYDSIIDVLENKCGRDVKVSYEIVGTDEVGKSKLEKMKETLKSKYDIPKKDVEEAVELEVEFKFKGDEDIEEDEETFYAVKIDGDWYICNVNGSLKVDEFASGAKLLKVKDDLDAGIDSLGDLSDLLK